MQVYSQIALASPAGCPAAVALGFFDGLHRGHAAVIERVLAQRAKGLCPAVFTFTMHDADRPALKVEGRRLITEEEKFRLLDEWGVTLTLTPDFHAFSGMSPEEFVKELLVHRLGAKLVACGEDFRFGRAASGDAAMLQRLCAEHGITVELVGAVTHAGERISSSWIRRLLEEGEVARAGELLGRAFGYRFAVVAGKRLGRTIASPTINQPIPDDFVRLRRGVYASAAFANGSWYPAVTNIGLRPTVEQTEQVNSETYLHGFSGDLYGQEVPVVLLEHLRDEQKFDSVERLRAQIQLDAQAALAPAEQYIAAIT